MPVSLVRFYCRTILFFEPVMRFFHLMRLWKIAVFFLNKNEDFLESVYGPSLLKDWDDHQFYLCMTGRSGFKLYDILKTKNDQEFVFIDIGANIGLYSLLADQNDKCLKAYAVEPNPIVLERLKKNTVYNKASKIEPVNVGVAPENGSKKLYFKDWHKGLGNFLEKGDHSIEVQTRNYTLFDELTDKHYGTPVFLKIDVEGFEAQVLREIINSKIRFSIEEAFIEISPQWVFSEDIDFIFKCLSLMGLKEVWRSGTKEQYDVYFKKPVLNKLAESERFKYGEWSMENPTAPRYSICVCNYNMGDTLERAMSSVAEQLDDRYEILILDDGSCDDSLDVLEQLSQKYKNIRYLSLTRDQNRLLGETRNISIRAARGEYVLLHIDADDVWEPYIQDAVSLFHNVEKAVGKDFLFVGPQLGVSKRDFLLKYGPYENIYRCEDRNMMFRLAAEERLYFMDFEVFRERLRRPSKVQFRKTIEDVWSHTMYDLRIDSPNARYVFEALIGPIWRSQFSFKHALLRSIIVLPLYLITRFRKKFFVQMDWYNFEAYHNSHRGNYIEIMQRFNMDHDLSHLSERAQTIFSYRAKSHGLSAIKNYKSVIVCMVYNSHEYLAEFIEYHRKLVDHIYLIDHKSKKDLRQLSLDNVTAVRTNHVAQFQSEVTNLVIDHFGLSEKYDWIMTLDIDEFLPFERREDLQEFFLNHQADKAVHFQWKNGTPFYKDGEKAKSLIECTDIRFYKEPSTAKKTIVNSKRLGGNFMVPTGAHDIKLKKIPFYHKRPNGVRDIVVSSSTTLPLYHIPAFDHVQFGKKIKNYVQQIEMRAHVKGQGGHMVQDYPEAYEFDNMLWYLANFRIDKKDHFTNVTADDFDQVDIFKSINVASCLKLRKEIEELPSIDEPSITELETEYLDHKTDDMAIVQNCQWFKINKENEIKLFKR